MRTFGSSNVRKMQADLRIRASFQIFSRIETSIYGVTMLPSTDCLQGDADHPTNRLVPGPTKGA